MTMPTGTIVKMIQCRARTLQKHWLFLSPWLTQRVEWSFRRSSPGSRFHTLWEWFGTQHVRLYLILPLMPFESLDYSLKHSLLIGWTWQSRSLAQMHTDTMPLVTKFCFLSISCLSVCSQYVCTLLTLIFSIILTITHWYSVAVDLCVWDHVWQRYCTCVANIYTLVHELLIV